MGKIIDFQQYLKKKQVKKLERKKENFDYEDYNQGVLYALVGNCAQINKTLSFWCRELEDRKEIFKYLIVSRINSLPAFKKSHLIKKLGACPREIYKEIAGLNSQGFLIIDSASGLVPDFVSQQWEYELKKWQKISAGLRNILKKCLWKGVVIVRRDFLPQEEQIAHFFQINSIIEKFDQIYLLCEQDAFKEIRF